MSAWLRGLGVAVLAVSCSCASPFVDGAITGSSRDELPSTGPNGEPVCPEKKALICHVPPGNPGNAHSLCVGRPAVAAHRRNHGDAEGACAATAASACDPTERITGTESRPVRTKRNAHACTGKKVLVCHIPPGNPANAHTLCIGRPAVAAHVRNHGDPLGACPVEAVNPPTGDRCSPPNGPCTTSSECSTLLCVNDVCKVPGGGVCDDSSDCASQLCAAGVCEGLPPGSACQQDAVCGSGVCTNGLCEDTAPTPPAPCTDPTSCPPAPVGGACTVNVQCASNACLAGTCVPGLPAGASCSGESQCASGACSNGLCQNGAVPNGASCSAPAQCISGLCVGGFCEGKPEGAACSDNDAECASNVCVVTVCSGVIN